MLELLFPMRMIYSEWSACQGCLRFPAKGVWRTTIGVNAGKICSHHLRPRSFAEWKVLTLWPLRENERSEKVLLDSFNFIDPRNSSFRVHFGNGLLKVMLHSREELPEVVVLGHL